LSKFSHSLSHFLIFWKFLTYLGSNSFKYIQSGASLNWNSSGLAQALNNHVKENDLVSFDFNHIEILEGCLVKDIRGEEKETWLQIYNDL
jgi:hypothetical protein